MFYTDNHFSGKDLLGMDWHLLGNGVATLECALILAWFSRIGAKGLRKLPVPVFIAFLSLAVGTGIVAQKTNGVNSLPPMPPRECKVESVECKMRCAVTASTTLHFQLSTLHSSDVSRGWRVDSVTTNETVSYTMPSNAVYVGNWHVHGARSSFGRNVVDFGSAVTPRPTGWTFPLGTNSAAFSSFWYFVDGRIRPTPKDAAPSPRASADMPFRARAWNRRGAWNDSFRCAFPGEWVFPHGTGHLDRVEVCSQGRILPRYGSTNVIVSIGVPLQIVNPTTSFGCGPTDRNSYVFAWTNAA